MSRPAAVTTPAVDAAVASRRREEAAAKSAAFTDWLTAWRRAGAEAQPGMLAPGQALAAARRDALKELIPIDPRLALELAVPVGLRGELPAEVEAQLERRLDGRGDWEVAVSCFGLVTRIDRTARLAGVPYEAFTFGRRAEQHTKFGLPLHGIAVDDVAAVEEKPYRMLDDEEKRALGIAGELLAAVVGQEVRILGSPAELEKLSAQLIAEEEKPGPYLPSQNSGGTEPTGGTPSTAATTPWINGEKRVLWVQVDFTDDPGGVATPAQIAVTNTQVSEFYAANSQGKTTMVFTVLPSVLRLPRDKSFYNASSSTVGTLQSDAAVAARAYDAANGGAGTYNPDRYDRWIVLFKRMPAYVFGGQAQLTGPQVRMNGTISPGTTAHELGHTQGLSHSHYWLPAGTSAVGAGAHVEYGDVFDAMGSSGSSSNNHFNAAQKSKLGYLDGEAITTVTQSGTYRVARHDHREASAIRGLKLVAGDLGYEYWVEHRRFGPNSFNSAQLDRLRNGALLHWGPGKAPIFTSGSGSYLVDATPGSAGNANDAPLRIGETFVDPDAGVTIRPLAAGGAFPNEYLDVQVAFGAFDGNRNPSLQLDLPPGTLVARSNLIFNVSATDPDGDPVYFRWDFGDRQVNPSLPNITRRFLKGGEYSLRVSAHDGKGGVAAQTTAFTVVDPLVAWTQRGVGVTTSALRGGVWAAGRFVVVGDASTVLTSPDGITWAGGTAPPGNSYRDVAYNGTRFVTAGVGPTTTVRAAAAYSDDGVSWTAGTLPANAGQIYAIAFGADRFVAAGETGRIYSSVDGVTWTEATSPVTSSLRSVAYADGLWVISGDSGRLLTSTDGVNWTNRSVATSNTLIGVARHNGAWFASSSTVECYTSADGIGWTRVATPGRTNNTLRVLSTAGVLFTTTVNGSIAFAEDVRTWTTHRIDATAGTSFNGATTGGGRILVFGSRGLIYSAEAPTTIFPILAAPTLRNEADSLKAAVGRKNVFAAGGPGFTKLELYANGTKVSELSGSAGALAWTPAAIGNYSLVVRGVNAAGESAISSAVPAVVGLPNWNWRNPSPLGNDLRGAVRVGGKWWMVGGSGAFLTLDTNGVLTSLDFPTTQNLTGIAYGNGRFVISGPYFDAGAREEIGSLWTSTDGYAWTPLLTTVFDNFSLNFVAFSGDQWLTGSTSGLLLTSPDGINWTRQISGLTTSIRAAAYGNGRWVAVGAGGRVITSTNGVAWTSRTTGVTTDLNAIAFNGGMFVAAGASGVILNSGDGVTWARQTSGVTSVLNGVGVVKGMWVAVGDGGVTRVSADLVTWSAAAMEGKFSNSLCVAGSGDQGVILGRAGEIYTTTDPASWTRLSQGSGEARYSVIHAGGRFVAVGQITDPITRTAIVPVSVSTSGVTWTRAAAPSGFTNVNDVAHARDTYVTVGDTGRIFTSANATTWTQRTSGVTTQLNAVAGGPDGFVAAGAGGTVLASPDGTAWTAATSGTTQPLRAAAFGSGRYVIVGDSGVVIHSTDGATWTSATSGVTASFQTIGWWEEFGFFAAGTSGTMINSLDGINWQQVETGVADTIMAITRSPVGLVAAAGGSGTLLVSLDGASWSTATLPVDRTIRGLAASASAIVAVGDNGALLTFEMIDTTPAPAIRTQPASQAVGAGNSVTLAVDAQNIAGAVFQWTKDGVPIIGANSPTYLIPGLNAARSGSYAVTITTATGSVTSLPAVVSLGVPADPGRLVNLSILTSLASASDSFTFGVVVGGAGTLGSKPLLVRAAGPSLTSLGVGDVLQDPKLEFFSGSTKVGENDNWGGTAALRAVMTQVGAFPFSSATSRDAAIALPDLESGGNSARISGSGPGTVIAELYDATPPGGFTATTPRLVNVSVLKHLGSGVTAGFVLGGSTSRQVLIRAVGPTLGAAPFNVPDVVADPQLALFQGQTRIAQNDNWGGGSALATAFAQVGAFALPATSRDAALLATLQPGSYTVQVDGVGGTTGVALVEVYEVP